MKYLDVLLRLIYNNLMINCAKEKIYKLLRSSEKWTKTDMVYLAKGGFWLSSSKIIGSVSAFILALVYANFLPKETYATYKYILSLAVFISIPCLIGLNSSLTRSIALGFEGSFFKVFKLKLKFGSLGFLVGLCFSLYYYFQGNVEISAGLLILAIFFPLTEALNIFASFLQGKKLFKQISIFNSLNNIVVSIAIVLAVYFSKSLTTIIFVNYSVTFLVALLVFTTIKKTNNFNNNIDQSTISFGKHLSLISILNQISEQIDKILTWHFLGPISLAIYSFATIPITQMQSFFKLIPVLAFPKIAKQSSEELKKTLPAKIIKFSAVISIIVFVYIITAEFLFSIFFPEYMESVKYTRLFSLTMLFFPVRIISQVLIAKIQKTSLYKMQVISPLIKLFLYLTLLPIFGLFGLVFAYLFSLIIDTVILLYLFKRI